MSRKRTEIISHDCEKVAQLLQSTSDPRDKERLIAARMAMTGQHTLAMIADAVGRARSCIQGWLKVFETGGVEALLRRTPPPGRPPSLSPEVKEQLHQHLSDGTWRTAREMRRWLKETHQIDLTLKGCYYWLGKSRGVLEAPRPCHHQQAPGAVLDFKMQHWQVRLASLSIPLGEPVRFWVMDESRFGLHTVTRHGWGLRGKRVVKPFQQRFDWAYLDGDYLDGAVDILSGEPVFCQMPTRQRRGRLDLPRGTGPDRPRGSPHHPLGWSGISPAAARRSGGGRLGKSPRAQAAARLPGAQAHGEDLAPDQRRGVQQGLQGH